MLPPRILILLPHIRALNPPPSSPLLLLLLLPLGLFSPPVLCQSPSPVRQCSDITVDDCALCLPPPPPLPPLRV
jgi:hypothetical protein